MNECILCGIKIDEQKDDPSYSYDQFLHEIDKNGCIYCKECKEILRCNKSRYIPKNEIIKVNIFQSDYPLPGYMPVATKRGAIFYIKPRKSRVKKVAR